MTTLSELAAQAAAEAGVEPFVYAPGIERARILIVQDGAGYEPGSVIGERGDRPSDSAWAKALDLAGVPLEAVSWWNAVPHPLTGPVTAPVTTRGARYLQKAVALHTRLIVMVVAGTQARDMVKRVHLAKRVVDTPNPNRKSDEFIAKQVVPGLQRAFGDAYPAGYYVEDADDR